MSGPQSAVVETLTAEVRVLMVGRRQVTLSVYRQLDRSAPEEVEPFGRVRDGQDETYSGSVYVVGLRRRDGALVRSECPPLIERPDAPYRLDSFERRQEAQRRHREAVESARRAYAERGESQEYPDLRKFTAEVDLEDAAWRTVNIIPHPCHAKWSELPLIVLAGLR